MKRCHACGKEWVSAKKQPAVKESCENCGAYLHCCLNCRFRDTGLHNQCAIGTTDWVADRAGCNFCDEFAFADRGAQDKSGGATTEARDAFDRLFGNADGDSINREAKKRDAVKRLFGD